MGGRPYFARRAFPTVMKSTHRVLTSILATVAPSFASRFMKKFSPTPNLSSDNEDHLARLVRCSGVLLVFVYRLVLPMTMKTILHDTDSRPISADSSLHRSRPGPSNSSSDVFAGACWPAALYQSSNEEHFISMLSS